MFPDAAKPETDLRDKKEVALRAGAPEARTPTIADSSCAKDGRMKNTLSDQRRVLVFYLKIKIEHFAINPLFCGIQSKERRCFEKGIVIQPMFN